MNLKTSTWNTNNFSCTSGAFSQLFLCYHAKLQKFQESTHPFPLLPFPSANSSQIFWLASRQINLVSWKWPFGHHLSCFLQFFLVLLAIMWLDMVIPSNFCHWKGLNPHGGTIRRASCLRNQVSLIKNTSLG